MARITIPKDIQNTLSRGSYYFSIAANGLITKNSTYVATPTALNVGDMINLFDGNYDDNSFTLDPISNGGFTPTFVGTQYSNLFVSGNGGFAFGTPNNNNNGSVASIPTLYMMNNDGNLQKIYYKVTGTTPDRILAYKIQGNTNYDNGGINYDYDIYFYEGLPGSIDVVVNQEPTDWNAYIGGRSYVTWGVTDGSNWVDGLTYHNSSIGAQTGLRITGGLRITDPPPPPPPTIGSDNPANAAEPNATAWVLMDGPLYNTPGVPASGFKGGQSWRKMAPSTTTNGKTDYIYGNERVYWDGANWLYTNEVYGIVTTISAGTGGEYPWLSTWSDNYTGAKITASYAKSTNYPAVP